MDIISGVTGQSRASSSLSRFNHGRVSASISAARTESDVYAPGQSAYSSLAEPKAMTGPQLSALSEKYNLHSLTRAQYGQLLKDLRDSGVITQKEFGDGYSGMVPGESTASALPCGQEHFDAVALMNELARRSAAATEGLKESEQGSAKALAMSYARLTAVFSKIAKFSGCAGILAGSEEKVNGNMIDEVRTPAMPGAYAARQVKAGNGSFQAALAETKKAEKASRTAIPDFSNMSDRQKLAALAKLHDSTDYSGMTDVEKYKLMNDRFEAAFPHLEAYYAGLYGPMGVFFENPIDQANHRKTIPELINDEQTRQLSILGTKEIMKLHKEAYYSGMNDEETISAIHKRHSGGTMADRASILQEMRNLGLGDKYAIGDALSAMRKTVCRTATGSVYGPPLGFYSEGQFRTAQGYASGTKVSWAEVKRMTLASAGAFSESLAQEYGKTIQDVIDELFDNLINAEGAKI